MPEPTSDSVVVRAIDEGRWFVYGPYSVAYASPFAEALELSGAFERVETRPATQVCLICGWLVEEGHDLAACSEPERAAVAAHSKS